MGAHALSHGIAHRSITGSIQRQISFDLRHMEKDMARSEQLTREL
jgi:hypothetical protein